MNHGEGQDGAMHGWHDHLTSCSEHGTIKYSAWELRDIEDARRIKMPQGS